MDALDDRSRYLSSIRPPGVRPGEQGQVHSQGHWGLSMKPIPLPVGEINSKKYYLYLPGQVQGVALSMQRSEPPLLWILKCQRQIKFTLASWV